MQTEGVIQVLTSTPQEVIDIFLQLGSDTWRTRWSIGDLTAELCDQYRDSQPVSIMDIYTAVSIWLNREISPRTVMYYTMVARAFSPSARLEYDGLPFSHFALAHSYGQALYKPILNLSAAYAAEHGYPPSAAWLRWKIENRQAQEPTQATWGPTPQEPETEPHQAPQEPIDGIDTPGEACPPTGLYEAKARKFAENLQQILYTLPIPQPVKTRVLRVLDELISYLTPEQALEIAEKV